jgi:integrase
MIADGNGLWLEVRPTGRLLFLSRYTLRGKPGRLNLGRFPQLSLTDARQRHSALLLGVKIGVSPIEQQKAERLRAEQGMTVREFAEQFIERQVSRVRKDVRPIRRYFERDVYPVIGAKPFHAVTVDDLRGMILSRIDAGHEQAALAIRNLLKRFWDYALMRGLADKNALQAIPAKFVAQVSSRSRALTGEELGAFLRSLDAARLRPALKTALRLILLTLTRKSEVRLAHWEEFNLQTKEWTLPAAHSKMKTPLVIPLSRQVIGLLELLRPADERHGLLFPMAGAIYTPMAAATLNRALERVPVKIEHFTVHDLRRTAATNLAEQEYSADWIEKAMNHKLRGVRGVYNRAQYATQRREMLQAWANWMDERQREQ